MQPSSARVGAIRARISWKTCSSFPALALMRANTVNSCSGIPTPCECSSYVHSMLQPVQNFQTLIPIFLFADQTHVLQFVKYYQTLSCATRVDVSLTGLSWRGLRRRNTLFSNWFIHDSCLPLAAERHPILSDLLI